MNEQLRMALSHALQVNRSAQEDALARARRGLLNPGGMGLDAKRNAAWCEYGFKERIEVDDFVNLYKRGGLAHGGVTKLIGQCWKTDPWLIEGEEQDESREETAWERKVKGALPENFWHAVAEADLRRLVCRYSALVLRLRDGKAFDQPVTGRPALVEVVAVWAAALKVKDHDELGNPTKWQYTPTRPDGTALPAVDIHPDRIVILGDYSADAIGFLEPAYNAFVSLEKVEGGSGEAFLKNASRQVVISFDKEVDLQNIATMYGVELKELQGVFNEVARGLNQGIDTVAALQGATATPLVADVPDPTPTYDINLQTAAAALDIPTKILVGMQTGERASSEDQRYWNARCQSRRVRELGRDIRALVRHLQRIEVIEPLNQFTVMWDDLGEATGAEKLANAKTMSDINSAALATGEAVFDANEIRVAAGMDPRDDSIPLPDEGRIDDGDETQGGGPPA